MSFEWYVKVSMTRYVKYVRKKQFIFKKLKKKKIIGKNTKTKEQKKKKNFNNFQTHKVYANMNSAFGTWISYFLFTS